MKEIEVFAKNGKVEHLAMNNERDEQFVSVCGNNTIGLKLTKISLDDISFPCSDCQWQLEKWLERGNLFDD